MHFFIDIYMTLCYNYIRTKERNDIMLDYETRRLKSYKGYQRLTSLAAAKKYVDTILL